MPAHSGLLFCGEFSLVRSAWWAPSVSLLFVASLITQYWNQLMEWLKRVETLRECVQSSPELRLKP